LNDLLEQHQQHGSKQDEAKKPLVTLYPDTNGWCPFCECVWLALEIKSIPYQEQLINLQDKPKWFLQMVPTGLVPAVSLHSDQIAQGDPISPKRLLIWESLDIMKALDVQFPDTPRLVLDD
jgi:glutathione S-transferase